MRAVTVYRMDYGRKTAYRTRHPIGSVLELRTYDRGNNDNDLLRLARRLFALDQADAARILIYGSRTRTACLQELNSDRTAG